MTTAEIYQQNKTPWGIEPDNLISDFADNLPAGAHVLDLGVGNGRNALYLAQKGFKVTGIDLEPIAIQLLNEAAHAAGVEDLIEGVVADISELTFAPNQYDGVCTNYTLHFLPEVGFRNVMDGIKLTLKPGGFVAIADLIKSNDPSSEYRWVEPQELLKLFEDWYIVKYEEKYVGLSIRRKPEDGHRLAVEFLAKK